MVSLFTLVMSDSLGWTALVFAVLLLWEILMRGGIMPRDHQMPVLLIMAGIIFSTMHQSSLGSIFLIVPHKLHALWYSPVLPIMFFISAVMVGPAMVILEGILSVRTLGRRPEMNLLSGVARAMPYLLAVYLVVKMADLVGKGAVDTLFYMNAQSIGLWLELFLILLPLVFFLTPEVRNTERGLLWASVMTILGIVLNRLNVAVTGVIVQTWETYYPSWMEIAITVGIVSAGLLVLDGVIRNFPIYEEHRKAMV